MDNAKPMKFPTDKGNDADSQMLRDEMAAVGSRRESVKKLADAVGKGAGGDPQAYAIGLALSGPS